MSRFAIPSRVSRKSVVALASVALVMAASAAQAAPSKGLKTFGTGDVTATSDSASIVNDPGEYGGVYLSSKSQSGKSLSDVVFEFRNANGDVAGGSPRLSIPIDTDNTGGTADGYAFLDVAGCGGTSGDNTVVSTQSATCAVNFQGVDYANWATFAAANPTYRIAPGSIPFIIADTAGHYAVDHIVLR
ncbi:MAG: hypothetical protein QOC82_112 [Frankiaceae bacterium]|nr:hypothetical protein [Frankiaceae bacterium]MDQ1698801.1 hypothetical protein [Frankiaceae bacterium]